MKRCVLIILAALAVVSCSKDSDDNPNDDEQKGNTGQTGGGESNEGNENPRKYISMTGNFEGLSVANSDLAFSLFEAMNEGEDDDDAPLLLSPVSLSLNLGMLNNGAAGVTRDAYMSVLGGDCADIDEMNDFYRTLVTELPTLDNTSSVNIANSQWSVPEFGLLPEYSAAVSDYFAADLHTLNLSTAVSDINGWCSDKTEGLIKDFYSDGEITEDTKTILLDALYFKGVWEDKFNKSNTYEDAFTNHDGSESTVSYMHKTTAERRYENEHYSGISLPFGNEAFSMQIILPNEGVSLAECISSLNTEECLHWKYGDYLELDIMIPKFSVEYKKNLEGFLARLGLEDAVYGGDYSNMSPDGLGDLRVKQATKFSIDEEGVVAAAVTGSGMDTDFVPSETGEFHVTRPFLYLIKENSSNTILFIGRITKL